MPTLKQMLPKFNRLTSEEYVRCDPCTYITVRRAGQDLTCEKCGKPGMVLRGCFKCGETIWQFNPWMAGFLSQVKQQGGHAMIGGVKGGTCVRCGRHICTACAAPGGDIGLCPYCKAELNPHLVSGAAGGPETAGPGTAPAAAVTYSRESVLPKARESAAKEASASTEACPCDVCKGPVRSPSGHLLVTDQIVQSPAYWARYFETHRQRLVGMGISNLGMIAANRGAREAFVTPILQSATPWLVCPSCVRDLDVDHEETAAYARRWWDTGRAYEPPLCGPGHQSLVCLTDAEAEALRSAGGGTNVKWYNAVVLAIPMGCVGVFAGGVLGAIIGNLAFLDLEGATVSGALKGAGLGLILGVAYSLRPVFGLVGLIAGAGLGAGISLCSSSGPGTTWDRFTATSKWALYVGALGLLLDMALGVRKLTVKRLRRST